MGDGRDGSRAAGAVEQAAAGVPAGKTSRAAVGGTAATGDLVFVSRVAGIGVPSTGDLASSGDGEGIVAASSSSG